MSKKIDKARFDRLCAEAELLEARGKKIAALAREAAARIETGAFQMAQVALTLADGEAEYLRRDIALILDLGIDGSGGEA